VTENFAKISAAVGGSDADAVLITSAENRFYAAGFRSTAGELVITGDSAALFIDSRYFEEASERIRGAEVFLSRRGAEYYAQIDEYLKAHGVKKLGAEEKKLSFDRWNAYAQNLSAELVPGQAVLEKLRAVKSREELAVMVKAQRIAEKAFNELLPQITRDATEKELAGELVCRMIKNGAEDRSFDPIVVSGTHSSVPHGGPRDVKIQPGFLTIDFGALYGGYCSDTTRTLCVGEPTAEMEKVYRVVLDAQAAARAAARPGISGAALDGVARRVIADAGYGEYFTHSLSHGVGIEIHEAPFCGQTSKDIVPAGAVLSDEPGIYIPGRFGVRIEDVLCITEDGCEDITELPRELSVVCG